MQGGSKAAGFGGQSNVGYVELIGMGWWIREDWFKWNELNELGDD